MQLVSPWTYAALAGLLLLNADLSAAETAPPDPGAVERGRIALTATSHLAPAWSADAYEKITSVWKTPAPDPKTDRAAYDAAVYARYGLSPAPYPNDGLPMGIRRATSRDGRTTGIQLDCMICHGGSIGGTSYVSVGNSQLDLQEFLSDLTMADSGRKIPFLFTLNTARGTVNAEQVAAVLLAARNSDLSRRRFPLLLGAKFPEMDVPAWWLLGRKTTMYSDGRTDARSVRANMQFLLGELSLDEFKALEPTFRDIQAYLNSLKPPKYPFPIDIDRAERGQSIFKKTCARCHGTYGPDGVYPNKIVPLDVVKTDPARALGMSITLLRHYNSTWFAEHYPAREDGEHGYQAPPLDGVWATAPYLHNGSVPTIDALLNSKTRPARFLRPPSTAFEHYDTEALGWKAPPFDPTVEPKSPEARYQVDTARFGLGNGGHTFGDKLTEEERRDVIEYLKTL